MNNLESLQQKTNGIIFIKSYPILNCFKPAEKQLIELVLSYQENNKQFNMKYESIATLLNINKQSVKDIVCRIKKRGVIITDHKSNYNGTSGGSHTSLAVDMDVLISVIQNSKTATEQFNKEPIQLEPTPVKLIVGQIHPEETERIEIVPFIESASKKYQRKTKNYKKRIDELIDLISDLNIKYVDELEEVHKSYFSLEIEDSGCYSRIYLFEKDVA